MKYTLIPKGSRVLTQGDYLCITTRDFEMDYVPQCHDFDPPIEKGTMLTDLDFYHNGRHIYRHPHFIDIDDS